MKHDGSLEELVKVFIVSLKWVVGVAKIVNNSSE